jgi:UPF0042 nucleotide-binding protein
VSKQLTIVIVTGCSGSGKSTALDTFEDAGFYCVDNMPVHLIPHFLAQAEIDKDQVAGWAFGMDLRDRHFLAKVDMHLQDVRNKGYSVKIVFLEADEQTLLLRYTQTRRHHPLGRGGSLLEAIRDEKKRMQSLRKQADNIIDTSHYTVHELKFAILSIAQRITAISGMTINVVSFGFKYGTPPGADMIIDVRFLDNPYFIPELKQKTGETKEINDFINKDPKTAKFLEKYLSLLGFLIPLYEKEGKAYLTIAIGCTGGRHRSVVIASQVYDFIRQSQPGVRLVHRDIGNA